MTNVADTTGSKAISILNFKQTSIKPPFNKSLERETST